MNNNRRKESASVRPLVIVLFVLLLCLPAISVISDISISDTPAVLDKQIKSDGRVHYRFRRIYNGSDVSAHHTGGNVTNLPTYSGKTTSWQKATVSNGASATELSLPMSGSAGSSSMALHTSSSASMHSLGGGTFIGTGHTNNVSGAHSSIPSMAYSATSMPSLHYNMPSTSLLAQNPTSSQGHAAAGPRRAGEYIWEGILYKENGDAIGYVDGDGNVWKDGIIVGHYDAGGFTTQGEAVDNPIGAPWILLLFAAAFALFTYIRKNKLSSLQPMKHSSLKILTLLSLLTLALPQAWGRIIYLNTSGAASPYNSIQWWVHIWGGTGGGDYAMTAVGGETNLYQVEIGDHTNIIFVPNSDTGSNWSNQTNNIEGIPGDKNCYNITGKNSGTWNTYGGSSTYTVSIDYLCGETTIKTPSSVVENVDNVTGVEITAPAISGYTFNRWIPGTGTTVTNATSATTTVKTTTGSGLQCQYTSNITQVYLAGTMTDWETNKRSFTTTDGENYTLTVSDLSTNSNYTFKIKEAGSWCGKTSKIITATEAGIVLDSGSGGDITLKTSATSGDYVFDYVLSTHTLSVTYPVACTTITDEMVAPIYYIYLGDAFNLPSGYTYAGSSLETNTIAANIFTANQLGEYDVRVTKTGFAPKDIKVRVYRYYVKHAWGWSGTASTSNPQYNAAWVWEPLTFVDATHASYTGTGGKLATNGANLCWDYTYDWAGVYQTDADAACNFHPGLDNASKQGKWGNGAHECNGSLTDATTGATTWKETSLTPGTIYDFVFNETLSGSNAPTNNTSSLRISGTSKPTYAVNFTAITNTSVSNDGGYITSTLGTISGVKALNKTAVTFTAHAKDGYTFKGWYSDADCTASLGTAPTYSTTVNGAAIQVYAKFVTTAPSGVYFVNTDQWETVSVYAWSGDNDTPGWPGTTMTQVGQVTVDGDNYDYYFYPVTTGKVIFNNGKSSGSSSKRQTANQNVQVGKYFMASDICYGDNGEPQPKTAWYDNISDVAAAHIGVCSGWYLHGSPFGGTWTAGRSDYPFNQTYREMSGVYYRVVSFADAVTKHFRVTDGTKTYSGDASSSSDYVIAADKTAATLTQNIEKSFAFTPVASHDYWFVVNTSDKTFWIEDPVTFHHVSVTETDAANYGEYSLKTTSTGLPANTATNFFAKDEHYLLTITAANSGVTPHITVNGEEESLSQSGDVYTYEGTMPGGDITIAITYTVVKDFTFETRVNGISVTETDFGRTIVVHTEKPINFTSTPGYQYTYSLDGGSSWRIVDAGTYVINSFGTANIIKFRARGSDDGFSTYVEKIINVTIPAATVSLSHSGSASVGGTLTLTATANISGGTYTFYVTAPGEAAPTSVYSGPNSHFDYTLPVEGHYSFSVTVTDNNAPHNIYEASANDAVDVTPHTYYLRYNFVNNADDYNNRSLNNVPMLYNAADGTYYYYNATVTDDDFYMPISSYNYGVNPNAAVMTSNRAAVAADWKTIHNNEVPYVANNTICVFHYDPNRDYVWISSVTTNYRVKSDGVNGTFYSNSIKSAGEKISFYASTDATLSWQTSDDGGASWTDAGSISTKAGSNGVWVAEPSALNATTLTLTAYTGAYYVNNTALSKQEMTDFTSTSTTYYDHYCVAYLEASTNVGATLGNTINTNLATRMPWYTLPSAANVRYEYTPTTNAFTRTLISGSSTDDFAQIYGVTAGEIYQTDGSTQIVKASALKLNDGSDWVYTADFKVKTTGGAIYAKLTGGYNGSQQWILARTGEEGAKDAKTLICGDRTTNGTYSFRLIYDYKTNQCISGWNPSDLTISSDISMDANFFVIRNALNSSTLQFIDLGGHNVDILKSIIFVLDIDRDVLFNSDNSPKHALGSRLFQVTLPYNITMGKIFGLPNYGTDWVIQDYKGELRKNLGYDGSSDFWATLLWSPTTTLKEGRGYVVSTTYNYKSFREFGSTAKKYLYFPTTEITGGYSLSADVRDTTYSELKCKKAGREEYDSDWRCIGARSFYPTKMSTNGNDDGHTLDYFYEWNGTYGNYTAWALEEDHLMQPTRNYMIQYHGKAQWTKQSSPSSVVARRVNGVNIASKYRIELQDLSGKMLDQTYIKLSADGNDSYVIGHDLSKSFSDEAPQIYSITAENELAGNNVADSTTFVKLGISLPESGEYVISLGNNGQEKQAILYDREQDRFTNLSYGASYSFSGIAGKQGERFYIRFAPASPETPTDAEDINTSKMSVTNMGDQLLINGLSTESPLLLYSPSGQLIYQATPAAEGLSIPAPSTAGVYLLRCGKETTRILIK